MGLGKIEFSYLPDGMVEVQRKTFEETQGQTIYFEDTEDRQLRVTRSFISEDSSLDIILDTEDVDAITIPFGTGNAFLIIKENTTTLMWEADSYLILMTGDIPSEEIIKVANGIIISN